MIAQKKPIVYRAYKFWGRFLKPDFINYVMQKSREPIEFNAMNEILVIKKDTPMYLTKGNWLIENDLGNGTCEFWVVEAGVFSQTYEKIGENLYQKKIVKVHCVLLRDLSAPSIKEIYTFMGIKCSDAMIQKAMVEGCIWINTWEGAERLYPNHVLIKGVQGEFYQMPFETFRNLYDVIKQ